MVASGTMRWVAAATLVSLMLNSASADDSICYYTVDGGIDVDNSTTCTDVKVTNGYSDSIDVYILDPTATAGVVCCDDLTSVVTTTCVDSCYAVDYATAASECAADGKRLCTKTELLNGALPTSCDYSYMHVWSSTAASFCPIIDGDLTCAAIADGDPTMDDGACPDATMAYGESPDIHAAYTDLEVAGIYCCGDNTAVCDYECQTFVYDDAVEACAGSSLCTLDQLQAGGVVDAVCGLKSMNVWSSVEVPCPTKVERFDVVYGEAIVELEDLQPGVNYVGNNVDAATLNFKAIVAGYVNSVEFVLYNEQGLDIHDQEENLAPFALFGDIGGDFAGSDILELGEVYTLKATPYVGRLAEPYTDGEALEITFWLLPESDRPIVGETPAPSTIEYNVTLTPTMYSNESNATLFPSSGSSWPPSWWWRNQPTGTPTKAPYYDPTATPANSPTSSPIDVPTSTPINVPTSTPFSAPTSTPFSAPSSSPTGPICGEEATLKAGQTTTSTALPALFLVETVAGDVVQEIEDFPLDNNRIYLHPDNDLDQNMVNVDGVAIADVDSLTLAAIWEEDLAASTATVILYDSLNEETLINTTKPVTTAGVVFFYGTDCADILPGLETGVYEVTVMWPDGTILEREFRMDPRENANLVPDENRPKADTTGNVDILDLVPFTQVPRDIEAWQDRPFNNNKERDKVEQVNRINFVTPGPEGDDHLYILMELTCVVYRSPSDQTMTFEERTEEVETDGVWFDLKTAIEEATADDPGGARTCDAETRQHSGLRTLAWHPNYAENGLVYFSYLETWTDDLSYDNYLSIYEGGEYTRALADAVVAEFKVVDGAIDSSTYRPLFRIAYNETGADYAIYEHPIKQCTFNGDDAPYVLYCGSGDGSVDSSIAFGGREKNIYGKILAIDVGDGEYTEPYTYGIPDVNTWGNGTDYSASGAKEHRQETFAIGVRNPHRIAFIKTGEYQGYGVVSEAGRDNAEEINVIMGPGGDYGWMDREGHYVHLDRSGIADGVDATLPADDAKNGYIYPATFLGHNGLPGAFFTAQAVIGSHVVENDSVFHYRYFFSNFPKDAEVYYSYVDDLMDATTMGDPADLTMAPIYTARLRLYETDADYTNNNYDDIYDIFDDVYAKLYDKASPYSDNLGPGSSRTDLRFGEGPQGELYIFSKRAGTIWIAKNTLPGVTTKPEL